MTVDSPETQPTHQRLARLERTVAALEVALTDRNARIAELEHRVEMLEADDE